MNRRHGIFNQAALRSAWAVFRRRPPLYITATACLAFACLAITILALSGRPAQSSEGPPRTAGESAEASPQQAVPDTSDAVSPQATTPPARSPAPAPQQPPPPPALSPNSVLGLSNWKLTLPVNTVHAGSPDEILQPELATFTNEYFQLNGAKDGVIFRAPVGGATTSNSGYPRSELREMNAGGKTEASWSNKTGVHSLAIRQAITHVPAVKPEVVAAQIHDSSDDVIMIRLHGNVLFVEGDDGKNFGTLDAAYALGTAYTVKIEAANGRIKVFYNGQQKLDLAKSGSGWYFKAGCYTQSNPSKGDAPDAYGQVIIYALGVSHI